MATAVRASVPHVVIVGGGFGGLYAARALADQPVRITLIDRRNFHLFQPLLYQVATGTLSSGDITSPLRISLDRVPNLTFRLGTMTDVDPTGKTLLLDDTGERLPYDYLIVAAGSQTSYFGNQDLARKLPGLKTIEDAEAIRQQILVAFEQADQERDPERRRALMTFVVVGGGPTGVELCGAISELAHQTLTHKYDHLSAADIQIILMEGLGRILGPYPEPLSAIAARRLQKLNVTLRLNSVLSSQDGDILTVKQGDQDTTLRAATVIWTAGVEGVPLGKIIADRTHCEISRKKTLVVEPDFSVRGYPDLFVVGDLCDYRVAGQPPLPGVAPAAMQAGHYVGRFILSRVKGRGAVAPFRYQDKGSLAVIGKGSAVAQIGRIQLSGLPAWLIWGFVHIFYLIGFANRVRVMLNWGLTYLLQENGSLIIKDNTSLTPNPSLTPTKV